MSTIDDNQLDRYIHCRKALGVGLPDVIKQAKHRHVSLDEIASVFDKAQSRDSAICALRDCGMSLDDIGKVLGLTRERIRQIIEDAERPSGKAAKVDRGTRRKEIPSDLIIRLVCTERRFWRDDRQGNLNMQELFDYFADRGYTERDVRDAIRATRLKEQHAKARLLITYWFNVPEDEHLSWLSKELTHVAQAQLLDRLLQSSPVTLSIMAFNRYLRSLGITAWAGAQGIRRSVGQDNDWSWISKI